MRGHDHVDLIGNLDADPVIKMTSNNKISSF